MQGFVGHVKDCGAKTVGSSLLMWFEQRITLAALLRIAHRIIGDGVKTEAGRPIRLFFLVIMNFAVELNLVIVCSLKNEN